MLTGHVLTISRVWRRSRAGSTVDRRVAVTFDARGVSPCRRRSPHDGRPTGRTSSIPGARTGAGNVSAPLDRQRSRSTPGRPDRPRRHPASVPISSGSVRSRHRRWDRLAGDSTGLPLRRRYGDAAGVRPGLRERSAASPRPLAPAAGRHTLVVTARDAAGNIAHPHACGRRSTTRIPLTAMVYARRWRR